MSTAHNREKQRVKTQKETAAQEGIGVENDKKIGVVGGMKWGSSFILQEFCT